MESKKFSLPLDVISGKYALQHDFFWVSTEIFDDLKKEVFNYKNKRK